MVVVNLMGLARAGALEVEPVELAPLLAGVLEKARRYAPAAAGVDVKPPRIAPEASKLETDRGKLEQALLNLVVNALEAMPSGGTLSFSSATLDGEVAIEVADTGGGISEEVQRRLFDPYFTTKPSGTGLGLALAHALVEALGGRIEVESGPGRGALFRIRLRARRSEA